MSHFFCKLFFLPKHTQPDPSSESKDETIISSSELESEETDLNQIKITNANVLPGYVPDFLLHTAIYKILSFFDTPPKMKPGETVSEYVWRVDKRHAVRRLNLHINTYPDYPAGKINRAINLAQSKGERLFYIFIKQYAEKREKYIFLKEQIQKGK